MMISSSPVRIVTPSGGLMSATRMIEPASVDGDGNGIHAAAVHGAGDLPGRAQPASRALAPVLPDLCLERYLCHRLSLLGATGRHSTGSVGASSAGGCYGSETARIGSSAPMSSCEPARNRCVASSTIFVAWARALVAGADCATLPSTFMIWA